MTHHSLREGRTPSEKDLNRFHLIESDFAASSRDDVYAWLKEVDGGLLISVIAFQKVGLLPRGAWLGALWRADCTAMDRRRWMKDQEEKMYRLIGQLASYRHPFNMVHLIPNEFKLERKPEHSCEKTETFSTEEKLAFLIVLFPSPSFSGHLPDFSGFSRICRICHPV